MRVVIKVEVDHNASEADKAKLTAVALQVAVHYEQLQRAARK